MPQPTKKEHNHVDVTFSIAKLGFVCAVGCNMMQPSVCIRKGKGVGEDCMKVAEFKMGTENIRGGRYTRTGSGTTE